MSKKPKVGTIIVCIENKSGLGVINKIVTFPDTNTRMYYVWMLKDKIGLYLLFDEFKIYA